MFVIPVLGRGDGVLERTDTSLAQERTDTSLAQSLSPRSCERHPKKSDWPLKNNI